MTTEYNAAVRRSLAIHIGVNARVDSSLIQPLQHSETVAWRMAGLAHAAGYDAITVLQGAAATTRAVHEALSSAASTLRGGDILFLSFAGHAVLVRDTHPDGDAVGWVLFDGELMHDTLAGYWRLFSPGVRILIVSDSSYGYHHVRDEAEDAYDPARSELPPDPSAHPRSEWSSAVTDTVSCIPAGPRSSDGIRGSVLMLTSSSSHQPARDGLFTRRLLEVWDDGLFQGSYCDLYRAVRDGVLRESTIQVPQMLMIGTADPTFPLEPAFHLNPRSRTYR